MNTEAAQRAKLINPEVRDCVTLCPLWLKFKRLLPNSDVLFTLNSEDLAFR